MQTLLAKYLLEGSSKQPSTFEKPVTDSVTYISKLKIKDQREEKVKYGEAWVDIDFKTALIPQLLTTYLSFPSS